MPPIVIEVREAIERAELEIAGSKKAGILYKRVPQYTSKADVNSTKIWVTIAQIWELWLLGRNLHAT